MHYSQNDQINALVKKLIREGWHPIRRKKHWALRAPNGLLQTIPGTPSDRRAPHKFKRDIKRTKAGRKFVGMTT
jgi:hypothetical protein